MKEEWDETNGEDGNRNKELICHRLEGEEEEMFVLL